MMMKQFDCKFCKETYSPRENFNKESVCAQLKMQQNEIEQSSQFIEELREKISRLEKCFNYLSSEKKSIEIETNKKISHLTNKVMKLQGEKEQMSIKYNSTKQKVKSMHAAHRAEVEIYRTENIKLQKEKEGLGNDIKDLIIENDRLIAQVNYYYTHGGGGGGCGGGGVLVDEGHNFNENNQNSLERGLEEDSSTMTIGMIPSYGNEGKNDSNESLSKLKAYIKNLEERNEALTKELDTHLHLSHDNNHLEIIIGLKRVISEKERTINNLYNNYDKLNIQYEDETNKNDKLLSQIELLKSQLANKTFIDNNNSNNPFINQY